MMTCETLQMHECMSFVLKICLKLVIGVSPRDDRVNAFMHYLNEFKHQFKGLTLESSSTKTNIKTWSVVTNSQIRVSAS